jgi:hypothetical protein
LIIVQAGSDGDTGAEVAYYVPEESGVERGRRLGDSDMCAH